MRFLDKLTDLADKAIKSVEKTSDKVVDIYKKEGVDGFLDRADKGLGNLEKKATQVTEQATSYAKEIAKSNKVEIEKVKKESNDDLGTVVNSSVAVAVNTVSTVARDVAKKAKELVGAKETTSEVPKDEPKQNAFEYFRFAEADGVDLEKVLKFVGAKPNNEVKSKFVDSHGNNISVQGKAWYDWNNAKGGTGAVSLLKYELDLSYQANGGKPVSPEAIKKEAVNILEQMALRQQVLDKELQETRDVQAPKAPAKKTTKKPVAKKVAKVAEVEESPKPARKAAAKKSPVKKPTMK